MCSDENDRRETDDTTARETDTVRHSWSRSDRPSTAIVEAVAAATGRAPTDLPPLEYDVDTDALDAVLTGTPPVEVTFPFAGTTVVADGAGDIEVRVEQ